MSNTNEIRKISKKTSTKKVAKKAVKVSYPKIYKDNENNYLSIKFKPGNEVSSYLKKGIVFLENEEKEVIEIQILNF